MQRIATISFLVVWVFAGCEFTYKIKSGEEAFEVKQYAVAAEMLNEEYTESASASEKARKAYMLGRSYEMMNNPREAVKWYGIAAQDNYGAEALVRYAENLARLERYEEAIEAYGQAMSLTGDPTAYRPQVTACRQASTWKANSDKSEYDVSPVSFNSAASDYAPYVMGPDIVLFTSDRPNGSNDTYKWTGRGFSDIYIAHVNTNSVEVFDQEINSDFNDGTVAMNSDRRLIYFSRCYDNGGLDQYCKLVVSAKQGEAWTEAEILPFVKEEVNYGHPALSANDSVLIFSCNDPEGIGGYDLYYSELGESGWAEPVLFSSRINTSGDEKFPSLHHDTLYFSSNHHVGMGGLDIFKTYISQSGDWTPPINLKAPVNSGWDDFGFVVDTFATLRGNELQKGYFSSSRESANGSDDVYSYKRIRKTVEEVVAGNPVDTVEKPINYELFLAIRVLEPVLVDPSDPNSERRGKRPLERARVNINEGMIGRQFRTDEAGYVILKADYDSEYFIEARFRGFLARKASFDATTIEKDPDEPTKTYNIELVLEPIFKGEEIILQNIYYDLDKWDIREDAEPALNELASILRDNPAIRIELGSHTDCRADDEYNLELSQKRAQSAVDYLTSRGIDASRMIARGYGETNFAVNCECGSCTEEQHQANRRTTFKIVD